MKVIKPFISVFFSLFITFCFAQYNNLKPKEIAERQLETLDEDLNLDDFQKLELRDFLVENSRKLKTAIENGVDDTETRFLLENNNRELNAKLKEVLLPEQFEKYIELKRKKAINKDKKKKQKSQPSS